jgi:predicted CXXCH cytochrome family protein
MNPNWDRQLFHSGFIRKTSRWGALIVPLLLLLPVTAMRASDIEHPGILHQDDNCSSCHMNKSSGRSVHTAMAISCTVCHLAQTQGDMTTLRLATPKEGICFTCHEKSTALRRHSPIAKGLCVDCHDAHSSDRRMLLRRQTDDRHHSSRLLPSRTETANRTSTDQP